MFFDRLYAFFNSAIPRRVLRLTALLLAGLLVLVLISVLGGGHLVLRLAMLWNVFLAGLGLVFAFLMTIRRRKAGVLFWILALLWLAFLPNAPYMFTDLIHISRYTFWDSSGFMPSLTAWLGLVHITLSVVLGCVSGFASLYLVHRLAQSRWGRRGGWLLCGGTSLLCGIAIYIGRFLRFNSWDLVHRPLELLSQIGGRLGWHTLAFCLLFATVTFGGYALFYVCIDRQSNL